MKKESPIFESFATMNLNTLEEREKGECVTCQEEREICEHEYCGECKCKHFCWLD